MELTIVGCSGSVPGPDSPASSYLVQAPFQGRTFSLVLDLGPGAFGALYRYLDPREVDAVALSHLHPDHCLDLCAFYVAARYSPSAPWSGCALYGPAGTAERVGRAYDVPGHAGAAIELGPKFPEQFECHDWRAEQQIGPFDVRTTRVDHPVETYAVRVSERGPGGGTLVFSGDTGPCEALCKIAAGVDVLLVEAAFLSNPGNPAGVHLTGQEAAETATQAGASTVILTHIPPWHDRFEVLAQAGPHFDGPVLLAEPGARWTIG